MLVLSFVLLVRYFLFIPAGNAVVFLSPRSCAISAYIIGDGGLLCWDMHRYALWRSALHHEAWLRLRPLCYALLGFVMLCFYSHCATYSASDCFATHCSEFFYVQWLRSINAAPTSSHHGVIPALVYSLLCCISCFALLCSALLRLASLCCAMLCLAMLCHAVLDCALLC